MRIARDIYLEKLKRGIGNVIGGRSVTTGGSYSSRLILFMGNSFNSFFKSKKQDSRMRFDGLERCAREPT